MPNKQNCCLAIARQLLIFSFFLQIIMKLTLYSLLLQNLIQNNGYCPLLFSQVWHCHDDKNRWCRIFMFLKDKKLYMCHDVQIANQLIRNLRDVEEVSANLNII